MKTYTIKLTYSELLDVEIALEEYCTALANRGSLALRDEVIALLQTQVTPARKSVN